ncbi:hypothetical protein HDU92_002926 [Lobulomyces angularis]|nr:hypothetical protein HDU92_002926 [Lobulomyces angularis]
MLRNLAKHSGVLKIKKYETISGKSHYFLLFKKHYSTNVYNVVDKSSTVSAEKSELVQHAVLSTFDLFSIGIGPSSSHTVGPMRAARIFVTELEEHNVLADTEQMRVDLYGSLALTGKGHGTDSAVLMGLEGENPESVDTTTIDKRIKDIENLKILNLNNFKKITFDVERHLNFHFRESLPQHPNGMRFSAFDKTGELIATNEFFSIGGGFVVNEKTTPITHQKENIFYKDNRIDHVSLNLDSELHIENVTLDSEKKIISSDTTSITRTESTSISAALPFHDAESLLRVCERENLSIAQVVYKNELHWRSTEEIKARTLNIWNVMNQSIENGISAEEKYLPGTLHVRRRAPVLYKKLMAGLADYAGLTSPPSILLHSPSSSSVSNFNLVKNYERSNDVLIKKPRIYKRSIPALDWINLYAIAVNEENAAGGRVVTAPTNGAAGVIPAVIKLLTSAAIGMLYKRGASISAAEMGCQGEVGVACSMAAAAFTAVMGGTVEQVENAAEIAMEHNLGLTCDPIGGLVQIPCIERNALGAVKAITAAQLSLNGDGYHRVSLDQVIETMRQTGIDMQSKYKETSQGGLAVNVPVC